MHEAAIEEQSHPFLQPVPYHNFWLDGKQSPQPIFATTRAKLDEVVTLVLDQVGNAVSTIHHTISSYPDKRLLMRGQIASLLL